MGSLTFEVRWTALTLVFALAPTFEATARADNAGVQEGLAWLRGAQRTDGLWGFDDRLIVRDTVEVLRAFAVAAPDDSSVLSAREALLTQAPGTADLEARLLEGLRSSVPEPVLAVSLMELAGMRSRQGGWGIAPGYETSDALDTALALRALAGTSYLSTADNLAALDCLSALQNADGGFGPAEGELSDLKTSAEVLRTLGVLSSVGNVDALTTPLVQFLLAQQNADGGFPAFIGGLTSDVRTTALVLSALVSSGPGKSTQYAAGRDYLTSSQLADGSWEDSAYVTALSLLALGKALPDLIVAKAEFTPSTTWRGPDVSLNISLANVGLGDAPATSVAVYLGDPSAGGTLAKTIEAPALPAGGMKSLTATISTMFTVETSLAFFVVADSSNVAAESCESNNRAVATLEISLNPPPIGDLDTITISSHPAIRATVGTTYTYQIVATESRGKPLWYNSLYGPTGMIIDLYSGLVTWPVNVASGSRVTFEIGALNANYEGAAQAWSVDVVDPGTTWPPTIDTVPSSVGVVGQSYLYALDGTDPDGGPVTYTLVSGPPGMVLNPSTNVISWTPGIGDVGDKIVRVVATDAQNETTQQEWTIVVDPTSSLIPDLVPVAIDLTQATTDPQSLHRDGAAVVTVANQGSGAAATFNVIIYEDRDGIAGYSNTSDVLLGTASVASLGANQRADVVVTLSGEALFRDNRVAVYVDPDNRVTESREDNNGDLSGNGTRFVPVPGPFRASLKWQVARPFYGGMYQYPLMVGQLNDDNGDGRIDRKDTPDVVAIGGDDTTVAAYDGRAGKLLWKVTTDRYGSTPAIADLDRDGVPEIYFYGLGNALTALNADGSFRWKGGPLLTPAMIAAGLYAIGANGAEEMNFADLDGDGNAEIVTRTAIVEKDGVTRCFFPLTTDIGNIVADINGDGTPEIIALPYVFRGDCSVLWSHTEWGIAQSIGLAVAQLDSDPQPEIVWTRADGVWVVEHDGTVKWKKPSPSGGQPGNTTYVSRPAIGDVDGDGQAEIVVNDRFRVGVYEADGTVRWVGGLFTGDPKGQSPVLADLDGDGSLEVILNDDSLLHIWRGKTGQQLFTYSNSYGTVGIPAIADVDGDGHLEIIVGYEEGTNGGGGLRVFGNANWAPGRGLWNQATYHVTNIQDDQTVPKNEVPSWQAHNTYQAQPAANHTVCSECGDTGETADLTASYLRVGKADCPTQTTYTVRVGNGGGRSVAKGVKVRFSQLSGSTSSLIGEAFTTKALASQQYEDVSISAAGTLDQIQLVVVVDPDQTIADGKLENNLHTLSTVPCSQYDNSPPHFTSTPALTAEIGRSWSYFPGATDANGDVVTFQLTTAPSGMVGPTPLGAVVWTPTAQQVGLQEVTIQATDGRGGRDVQSFLVEVKAPVLVQPPPPPQVEGLSLKVTTDKLSYGPSESVTVNAIVHNENQAGRAGSLRVEIQDSTGMVLATAVETLTLVFVGPTTQAKTGQFNTGTLIPGAYRAVASYDEATSETRSEAPFTVTGSPMLSVSVTTDHSQYGANESVRITGQMQNGSPNAVLEGIVPKLSVLDGASAVLAEQEFAVVDLGQASQQRQALLFDTENRSPGDYHARFELRQAGVLIGSGEAHFTLVSSATRGAAMNGDITCNPTTVPTGSSFALTGVMANAGNAALTGLDVRLQVLDPATQQIVREQQSTADLAMGANSSVEAIFSSAGLAPKSYVGRLQVSLGGRTLLSVATQVLSDSGPPPTVEIQVPSCGSAEVTPTITVTGGAAPVTLVAVLDQTLYGGGVVSSEGAHDLEVQVTDAIGRVATASARFIIDRTPPMIGISGVSNGAAYRSAVMPTITYTDSSSVKGGATLNGQPFISGTEVAADGVYSLVATASDCAGNTAQVAASFLVDSVQPTVSIGGVLGCSQGPVSPVVSANDAAEPSVPPTTTCWLDSQALPSCAGIVVSSEGDHQLDAIATDRAGNPSEAAHAAFVVDRTPPRVQIEGVSEGSASSHAVTPLVVASDQHLTSQGATLNGVPFSSGTTLSTDGAYVLQANAQDCAGNQGSSAVHFDIDTQPPQIVIDVPACSAGLVIPVITVTEAHVVKDERLLDGQPYDNGGVTSDGKHTLKVTVTDAAGNTSTRSVDFTVDNSAPAIVLSGAELGKAYNHAVTPVVVFQDAVEITLTLNGEPFTSGTAVTNDGEYVLSATAKNCAGKRADLNGTFRIDQVAPTVSIDVGACQEGPVSPLVTVNDAHLASDQRTLDGQPWDGSPVVSEGTHIIKVVAIDDAGNSVERSATFVVDNTPPAIAVAGVADGAWYGTPVTPIATITESNLTASTMTLDDQAYLNETPVGTEGSHVLVVSATDCAGHSASQSTGFGLDFTPPHPVLGALPACTALDVTPVATADEPVSWNETLDSQPYRAGVPVVAEGSHHLDVVATDRAGNSASLVADFIIDRTVPQLSFGNVVNGGAYKLPVTPLVNASDANLVSVSSTLDGQPFASGAVVSADGVHVLSATATDCAGHGVPASASFLIDKVSPSVTITVPACAAAAVTPVISVIEANLASQTQTLDGANYGGGQVSAEGVHDLSVVAIDKAGNQGSGLVRFTIDKTAPNLTIAGVQEGVIYQSPVAPTISASDANLTSATATLNGVAFTSGTLVSSDGSYTLVATANDCAGNQVSRTVHFQIQSIAGSLSQEIDYGSRTLLANEYVGGGGPGLLRSVLTNSAIPWEEGTTRSQWLAKLRSGRFNQVVLYEPAVVDGGSSLPELNEAIWLGDGLVIIKDTTDPLLPLSEAEGASFSKTTMHPTSLNLLSPLQPATVAMSGTAVKLQLTTATSVARPQGDSTSVTAALNGRGLGEALTLAWNSETSGSQLLYQSMVSASAPASGAPLLAGGTTRLRTTVHNPSLSPIQYTLVHAPSSALCTMDPVQYTIVVPAGSTKDQILTVHLPTAAGNHTITSTLLAGSRQLDQKTFTFAVTLTTSALHARAVAGLQAVNLTGSSAQKRDQAVALLGQAAQAATPLAAVGLVWRAIDAVRGITAVNMTANRVDLSRLLRSYEMATGGSGVSANLDGLPCFGYGITAAAACDKDGSGCMTINANTYVDSYSHSQGSYGGSNKHSGSVAMRCNDRTHDPNNTCVNNCVGGCISGSIHYLVDLPYPAIAEPPSVTNTTQINVNSGQSVTLDPAGAVLFYDTLAVNSGGTLTLKAGSYVVNTLLINAGSTFKADGAVRLWVRNPPSPNAPVLVASNNPRDFWLIYSGTGTINNNSGGLFYGVLFAPSAKVNLNYEVFGAVVAGGLTLNSGAKVHYDTDLTCPAEAGPNPDGGVPSGTCTNDPGASF